MNKSMKMLLALLAVFALIAAACGDDDDTDAGSGDDAADSGDDTAAPADDGDDMADDGDDGDDMADDGDDGDDMADDMGYAGVGEGVEVKMGRANWSTGYVQAEIYKQILEQAGYSVTAPGDQELAPALGYHAMVDRDIDFWANSWYPGHNSWLAADRPDGTLVAEHVTKFQEGPMPDAGLQGFLITKATADEHGITSIQQINDTPELVELFDDDGDGKAEIYGCPESWTCDDITESMIAFHGWDNIVQTKAGYEVMVAEAIAKVEQGDPMVIYTWQPSGYVANLRPGDNVLWITTHPTDVLDDSNPLGLEGGEGWAQGEGFSFPDGDPSCTHPCQLGWEAADIIVTANSEFLAENPFLNELFKQIRLNPLVISKAILEYDAGDGSEESVVALASTWIQDNADTVEGWLTAAYDASS